KLGVFWHTQGSGKSYSMVFFCQKIHRKVSAGYTFVVMTDRTELDGQIYRTFVGCGASTNKGDKARDGAGLRRLLKDQNRRYVFSLIHKFHDRVDEAWSGRDDIIVVSDEAHRTQYGRLALNMRKALAQAKFIGFTGTPLIEGPEKQMTREVFGDYVSIYDFQRAVADGATLPLYYENRGEKLKIVDPEINRRIEERIQAAKADGELDEEQEEKLYRQLARDYPVLTSDTHLGDVAADLVEHFHQRWRLMETPARPGQPIRYGGNAKAMLVCIDKITCGRMYELISAKWATKISELEIKLANEEMAFSKAGKPPGAYVDRLRAQIAWMRETRMAAVFSPEQNEVKEFKAWDLDVRPHRELMNKGMDGRDLEECFKDSAHPFRVAIVCAMWLTGFDVKPLATLYLDKPMQGHTLMQAIARVNRVAAHKKNGLIIDYNGMLKSLRKALATFAQGDRGGPVVDPLRDDSQALADYADAIAKGRAHLAGLGYALERLIEAEGFDKQQELLLAENAVCRSPESKKTFQVLVEDIEDRFRGLFPNPGLFAHDAEENALSAIYNRLQKPTGNVDISGILQELHAVVDTALATAPPSQTMQGERKQYDLSGIDFERLRAEFAKSPVKQTIVLTLMERIEARLAAMLAKNPTRIDFYTRYRAIVDEYNKDKDEAEIQRVFEDLFRVHDSLDEEALRYSREGFDNDEQLAVFDLLSKDKTELTKADREKIKKVAKTLLATLEERRQQMANLRDRASAQANLKLAIIDEMLNGMPEEFSNEEINVRAEALFLHVGGGFWDITSPSSRLN
ncbi:MAG: HsdR family type I site-specific deoxyribonuclease, partial [Gallionellaceae bacterium]|nr:HsdR family type I site-specific deoxyribonuclease [Gallionellaceae bacterium]